MQTDPAIFYKNYQETIEQQKQRCNSGNRLAQVLDDTI